jgi:hypothetical protein
VSYPDRLVRFPKWLFSPIMYTSCRGHGQLEGSSGEEEAPAAEWCDIVRGGGTVATAEAKPATAMEMPAADAAKARKQWQRTSTSIGPYQFN